MKTENIIAKPICFTGTGIHSGEFGFVGILPPTNPKDNRSGIFINGKQLNAFETLYSGLSSSFNGVRMTEHLLGFLMLKGIRNARITTEKTKEIPALDGSAKTFLDNVPIKETNDYYSNDTNFRSLRVVTPSKTHNRQITCIASGSNESTRVIFDYHGCREIFSISKDTNEILCAPTFVFKNDIDTLRAKGYGKGAIAGQNVFVVRDFDHFRENQRKLLAHKVLDLFGDLAYSGHPGIFGLEIHCQNSGHQENLALAQKIAQHVPTS